MIPDLLRMAVQYHQSGALGEAEQVYRHILSLDPNHADAWHLLGVATSQRGEHEPAITYIQRALELRPGTGPYFYNMGLAYKGLDKVPEAIDCFEQAIRFKPDHAPAYSALGNLLLLSQGKIAEARSYCQKALELNPYLAEGYVNMGNVLLEEDRPDEALASFERAIMLRPDLAEAHWNRSLQLLLRGDWQRGWPDYEWRFQAQKAPLPYQQPRWDGSSLAGKTILCHAEQGNGDTLQFVRYLPAVKEHGGTVILRCQAALRSLLASCAGVDSLISPTDPLPHYDVHVPLLSLPGIFGTTVATVPNRVPYLFPEPVRIDYWRKELAGGRGFKVGVVWQGNPQVKNDAQRSIPLKEFSPLAKVDGATLISLQVGLGSEQIADVADRLPLHDLGSRLGPDFADGAALVKNLDLVVTSDTAMAHLAGGLAAPVWVALCHKADWRWLLDRDDCPWYPTMRLFRQARPGDWSGVFQRIAAALAEMIRSRASRK